MRFSTFMAFLDKSCDRRHSKLKDITMIFHAFHICSNYLNKHYGKEIKDDYFSTAIKTELVLGKDTTPLRR